MAFSYSDHLWPWSGFLAVHISVSKSAKDWEGTVNGLITLNVTSPSQARRIIFYVYLYCALMIG